MDTTLPDIDVTGHRRLNSGAWVVDVKFVTNVGTIRVYCVYAKRHADGTLVVKPPAVRYGEYIRGTVGFDRALWDSIAERVTVAVNRAERKERQYAERLLGVERAS